MAALKDRDRPLQALSLKRIVKTIEGHWDEPPVLAGILHELRFRLEPDAAFQARSVARRLSTLRYQLSQDAARIAEESRAAADAVAVLAPEVNQETDEHAETTPRRRRRWLVLGAGGIAAALAAVWLLRPDPQPTAASAPAGPGLAVTASGIVRPHGQSNPLRPPSAFRRDQMRSIAADEKSLSAPSGARHGGARETSVSPEIPSGPLASGVDDTTRAPLFGTPSVKEDLAVAPAFEYPRHPLPERQTVADAMQRSPTRAETGVRVTDAAVDCYVSDRNPDHCGAVLEAYPTPSVEAAGDTAGGSAFGAVDPVDAAAPMRLPSLGVPRLSPPAAGRIAPPGRPVSPLFIAAAPPAVAGTGLRTSPDEPTVGPSGKKDPREPPRCTGAPPMGKIVFVLDGTLSMGLPLGVDGAVEDQLDEAISRHDADARRQYRALLAEPGPKRITRAREAFAAAAQDLPDWVDLGLVVFQECKDVRKVGTFEAARRGRALDYIRSLIPHGRTPIAAGLRRAAEMLDDGPSSIVLMTDGRESCAGDPCAAAAEIHRAHPDTPIHIVDITGQAKAECVADITGGRTYTPAATDDLAAVLARAFRGDDAQCARTND